MTAYIDIYQVCCFFFFNRWQYPRFGGKGISPTSWPTRSSNCFTWNSNGHTCLDLNRRLGKYKYGRSLFIFISRFICFFRENRTLCEFAPESSTQQPTNLRLSRTLWVWPCILLPSISFMFVWFLSFGFPSFLFLFCVSISFFLPFSISVLSIGLWGCTGHFWALFFSRSERPLMTTWGHFGQERAARDFHVRGWRRQHAFHAPGVRFYWL